MNEALLNILADQIEAHHPLGILSRHFVNKTQICFLFRLIPLKYLLLSKLEKFTEEITRCLVAKPKHREFCQPISITAGSLAVSSGGDIYNTGSLTTTAVYWENGIVTVLPGPVANCTTGIALRELVKISHESWMLKKNIAQTSRIFCFGWTVKDQINPFS